MGIPYKSAVYSAVAAVVHEPDPFPSPAMLREILDTCRDA